MNCAYRTCFVVGFQLLLLCYWCSTFLILSIDNRTLCISYASQIFNFLIHGLNSSISNLCKGFLVSPVINKLPFLEVNYWIREICPFLNILKIIHKTKDFNIVRALVLALIWVGFLGVRLEVGYFSCKISAFFGKNSIITQSNYHSKQ